MSTFAWVYLALLYIFVVWVYLALLYIHLLHGLVCVFYVLCSPVIRWVLRWEFVSECLSGPEHSSLEIHFLILPGDRPVCGRGVHDVQYDVMCMLSAWQSTQRNICTCIPLQVVHLHTCKGHARSVEAIAVSPNHNKVHIITCMYVHDCCMYMQQAHSQPPNLRGGGWIMAPPTN